MSLRAFGAAALVLSAALAIPAFGAVSTRTANEILASQPLRFDRIGDSYLARARDYDVRLDGGSAIVARGDRRIELRFAGAAAPARMGAEEELPGRTNYLIGTDASGWIRNARGYAKVRLRSLYRGIDALFYGNGRDVEVDLVVGRHADPKRIAIDVSGADRITEDDGNVRIEFANDAIVLNAPRVYQRVGGKPVAVPTSYRVDGNRIRFDVASYDRSKELVIDPVVTGTLVGVDGATAATCVVVDAQQFTYVGGQTVSSTLQNLTQLQPVIGGGTDAFVAKIDSSGNVVLTTYVGGSGNDVANGIAVDNSSNIYIAGSTTSSNFPVLNPIQATLSGGQSGFLTKLNSTASAITYSTFFGGPASINAVAVDTAGNAFIAGDAQNIPTVNPIHGYRGQTDAFVAKINAAGTAATYSTYLGGGDLDSAKGVAVSSTGNAWAIGTTYSPNFDLLKPYQQTGGGGEQRSTDGGLSWTASNQGLTRGSSSWISFDPTNPLNVFKADFRGCYMSTDGGVHWTPIIDPASYFITPVVVDPTTPHNIYAGDTLGSGVRKSTDGGLSFTGMNSGLTNMNVYSLAIDSTNASNIYAGTSNGLFKSTNGAASWSATGLTSGFVHTIAIDLTNPLNVWVGTDRNGVKLSTDGGATFNSMSTGIPFTPVRWLSINPANTLDVLGATDSGIFRTTNGGTSWSSITGPLGNPAFNFVDFWPKPSASIIGGGVAGTYETKNSGTTWSRLAPGGAVGAFAYAPTSPNTAIIGSSRTSGFLTELDPMGALLFSTFFSGSGSDLIADLKLDGSDNPTFAGTTGSIDFPTTANAPQKIFGGGATDAFLAQFNATGSSLLYSTLFGGSGADRGTGVGVGPDIALVGDTPSTDLPLMRPFDAWGGAHPWFKSVDDGTTWSGRPIPGSLAISPKKDTLLFAGSGPVERSVDGGKTWTISGTGSPSTPGILAAVEDYFSSPFGDDVIADFGPFGIYISDDDGDTWSLVKPADVWSAVSSFAAATMSNGRGELFVATDGGVLRSQDSGATWTMLSSGLPVGGFDDVAIDPSNPNTVYASNFAGVYKSTDGGNNFSFAGTLTGGKPPYHIAVDPGFPLNVFIASKGAGVYKSTDGAATFTTVNNPGLMSLVINSIMFGGNPSRLLVGADDGIIGSTNGGTSWTRLGLANLSVTSLKLDPLDANIFYAQAQGHSSIFAALFQPPASGGQLIESSYIAGSSDTQTAGTAFEDSTGKVKIAAASAADDDPATGTRQQWTSPPPPPSGSSGTTVGATTAALARAYGVDISGLCDADVAITNRTMSPNPIPSGGTATITYTVTNNGPDASDVIFVYDPAQTGTAVITITGATASTTGAGSVSSNRATCDLGILAAGATATVTITGTAITGPFKGSDHASAAGCVDPNIDNNHYSANVVVAAPPYPHGDANGDGAVNAADVFYLLRNLFAGGTAPLGTCDVNGDGVVDLRDVFYLINYLFAGGAAPR